jgi:hypothetical protein
MVFAINPTAEQSFDSFQAAANASFFEPEDPPLLSSIPRPPIPSLVIPSASVTPIQSAIPTITISAIPFSSAAPASGLSSKVIGGIVAGSIIGLVLLAVLGLYLLFYRRRRGGGRGRGWGWHLEISRARARSSRGSDSRKNSRVMDKIAPPVYYTIPPFESTRPLSVVFSTRVTDSGSGTGSGSSRGDTISEKIEQGMRLP